MTEEKTNPEIMTEDNEIPVTVENSEASADLEGQHEKSEEEIDYLLHLQRLQAEFDNYRKRTEKEKGQQYLFGKSQLMLQLLPVLDDFERLLDHHEENGTSDNQGHQLIFQKLVKTLTDEGLQTVETENQDFNPEVHEALSMEDVDDEAMDHKILEAWQKGYCFNERLLRPARVKVARFVKKDDA